MFGNSSLLSIQPPPTPLAASNVLTRNLPSSNSSSKPTNHDPVSSSILPNIQLVMDLFFSLLSFLAFIGIFFIFASEILLAL